MSKTLIQKINSFSSPSLALSFYIVCVPVDRRSRLISAIKDAAVLFNKRKKERKKKKEEKKEDEVQFNGLHPPLHPCHALLTEVVQRLCSTRKRFNRLTSHLRDI